MKTPPDTDGEEQTVVVEDILKIEEKYNLFLDYIL